jgi:3-isopropylmalate/(R)-2-methylmalate dehydratase large subunit
MAMTFTEKVLAAHAGLSEARAGQIVTVRPDFVMSHDNTGPIYGTFKKIGAEKVVNPERCVIVLDHAVPPSDEKHAGNHAAAREFVKRFGVKHFYEMGRGICHQVLPEEGFAVPGALILGSDSHTCTYGAYGCFSSGIGRTEVAAIWATGELWLKVPQTLRYELSGRFPKGVYSKDLMLRIIGDGGADGGLYAALEFIGPLADEMSIASRMVMTNMAVEFGAKNGYFYADDKTTAAIGELAKVEPKVVRSDPDAQYAGVFKYDVTDLEPQVAKPHSVDNVSPVGEVAGERVDIAFLGSCTNTRMEDLEIAASIIRGRKVAKNVRMQVHCASRPIFLEALRSGVIETFAEAGAIIMNTGCGPCMGAHEGIPCDGEKVISSSNRNFRGRMGNRNAEVYLASPATVAASAVTGKITDPREFLG